MARPALYLIEDNPKVCLRVLNQSVVEEEWSQVLGEIPWGISCGWSLGPFTTTPTSSRKARPRENTTVGSRQVRF